VNEFRGYWSDAKRRTVFFPRSSESQKQFFDFMAAGVGESPVFADDLEAALFQDAA
jgi:hypothetical protein